MKKELDDQLCAKYPKIFVERNMSMQETCMCWGFCCGDGWFTLIDNLCAVIQNHCDNHPDVPQVVAKQVKEKFGSMRYYHSGGDDFIDGAISFAEDMSNNICEECGNLASNAATNGWYQAACDTHRARKPSVAEKKASLDDAIKEVEAKQKTPI